MNEEERALKEKISAHNKQYYIQHRAEISARRKRNRAEDPEKERAYCRRKYAENQEKRLAYAKRYRVSHAEDRLKNNKLFLKSHPLQAWAWRTTYNNLHKFVAPPACSTCGREGVALHKHHPNYEKPMEVVWLCARCHGLIHRGPRKEVPVANATKVHL